MIFVLDAVGRCVHLSQDWLELTGQAAADAIGQGFLDRIHPDDRPIVKATRDAAIRHAAEYSLRYRLIKPDGTYRWVGAGGIPSFGMDSEFIGFLGSITELADGATDTITAYGNVERFVPPAAHPATRSSSALDLIADHLIQAHALIEGDGGKEALPDLRRALFKIGRALAARTMERTGRLN